MAEDSDIGPVDDEAEYFLVNKRHVPPVVAL